MAEGSKDTLQAQHKEVALESLRPVSTGALTFPSCGSSFLREDGVTEEDGPHLRPVLTAAAITWHGALGAPQCPPSPLPVLFPKRRPSPSPGHPPRVPW